MIKKRYCKYCKHLGLDGMFGLICDIGGNNKNYNCPQYEEDEDLMTKMSNRIDKLEDDIWKIKKENEQLRQKLKNKERIITAYKDYLKALMRQIGEVINDD